MWFKHTFSSTINTLSKYFILLSLLILKISTETNFINSTTTVFLNYTQSDSLTCPEVNYDVYKEYRIREAIEGDPTSAKVIVEEGNSDREDDEVGDE